MATDTRAGLIDTIRDRRRAIKAYVDEKEPASTRLSTISIISSSMAAALTLGPGAFGPAFAETVQEGLDLGQSSTVWRVLCLGAVVVSVTAAVTANLNKAHDLRSRIGAAEAAGVLLDGLRTRLEFGRLSVQDAAQQYQDILASIPFVHEASADAAPDQGADGGGSGSRRELLAARTFVVVAILAGLLLVATLVGYVLGLAG